MVKSSNNNNPLLLSLLVLIMIIVLFTSSFFYFSILSGSNVIQGNAVYDSQENESDVSGEVQLSDSQINTSVANLSEKFN